MAMEIAGGNLWQIVGAIAAAGGLGFTGYQLYKNNQTLKANNEEQKESNRVRELQLLESAFQQIIATEQLWYERYKDKTDKKEIQEWGSLFFNRLEWLAFLINQKFMTDKELVNFFKDAIVGWYETLFVNHFPMEVINDDKSFPSLKKLYRFYKGQHKVNSH
jgi:hypothetical protein